MSDLGQLAALAWGTVLHRPYVVGLFATFAALAGRHLGARDTVVFALWAWSCAFAAEYASTRWGVPFGLYHYLETTRGRELWLSNVPVWDSLSFVFLAYFAWLAAASGRPGDSNRFLVGWRAAVAGALVMTAVDVVIDPVAVRGERWFLGHLYYYPSPGAYFGVPAANFVGWAVTGLGILGGFVALARVGLVCPARWAPATEARARAAAAVLGGVLALMVAVSASLHERPLLAASGAWSLALVATWALVVRCRRRAQAPVARC